MRHREKGGQLPNAQTVYMYFFFLWYFSVTVIKRAGVFCPVADCCSYVEHCNLYMIT